MRQNIWDVNWPEIPEADRPVFESQSALLAEAMTVITRDRVSGVSLLSRRAEYYVKTFSGRSERLKYLLGVSRFQRELRNLAYFSALGLSTPTVIAVGRQGVPGWMASGVLATLGIPRSRTLESLLASHDFYAAGPAAVQQLLSKLACAARVLHGDGFFHRDLKTRNILVKGYPHHCELYFFDCPSGHHSTRLFLQRNTIRDLAYLERGLRGHLRSVDMLYLFKVYRGCDFLSGDDKAFARKVMSYYGRRRMTKKRRQRAAR